VSGSLILSICSEFTETTGPKRVSGSLILSICSECKEITGPRRVSGSLNSCRRSEKISTDKKKRGRSAAFLSKRDPP
jgi:hypothetical protein